MDAIEKLKELFKKFPGIGPKQAERFVFFLLHSNKQLRQDIANAIIQLDKSVTSCESCERFFVDENDKKLCAICANTNRNSRQLIIVEKESDIDKIENANTGYNGKYFISKGTVSPLKDSLSHKRYIDRIKRKLQNDNVDELILAFSTTFEGEYSAKFVKEELLLDECFEKIKITTLGRGLSSGAEIEYADPETLKYALKNRLRLK